MFMLGFDCVGGHYAFDGNFSSYDFTRVDVQDCIVDEIHTDLGNKEFNSEKGTWESNTVFLATFNGNLEAGNLSMGGSDVDTLRFKKRQKGTLRWLLIDEVEYDPNQIVYEVRDRLARSSIEYEYAIVPVTGNVEGEVISNSIRAAYEGLWIVDADESVNIFCDVDYGTITHNANINSFELLDARYPITIAGELNYLSGTSSGHLLALESWEQHKLDYDAELNLRERTFAFMKNGKPKILKNDKGRYYLIMAKDVKETPHKRDNASAAISFNWVEIGDAEDLDTLINCGLLPEQLGSVG